MATFSVHLEVLPRSGELEQTIIESGLHGERFFHSSGNWFALATKHG